MQASAIHSSPVFLFLHPELHRRSVGLSHRFECALYMPAEWIDNIFGTPLSTDFSIEF